MKKFMLCCAVLAMTLGLTAQENRRPRRRGLEDVNKVRDLTLDSLNKANTARPVAGSSRKGNNPVLFLVGNSTMRTGTLGNGNNVKEVTTQVSEAAVDCGIIYQTDAFSAGLTVVDTATAEMCGQVIYPAAVLNVSKNAEAAEDFLEFLTSDAADAVFSRVGFTPVV